MEVFVPALPPTHLVVICQLLPWGNGLLGIDADLACAINREDLGVAVGVTAVVDEACPPTSHRGISHPLVVHPDG